MRLIFNFFKILVIFGLVALLVIFFAGLINFLFLVISFDLVTWSFLHTDNYMEEPDLNQKSEKEKEKESLISSIFQLFLIPIALKLRFLAKDFIDRHLTSRDMIVYVDANAAYLDYIFRKFNISLEQYKSLKECFDTLSILKDYLKSYLIHAWNDFSFFNFFFGETWLDFFIWLIKWFFGPP